MIGRKCLSGVQIKLPNIVMRRKLYVDEVEIQEVKIVDTKHLLIVLYVSCQIFESNIKYRRSILKEKLNRL